MALERLALPGVPGSAAVEFERVVAAVEFEPFATVESQTVEALAESASGPVASEQE